jgi:hypothetical protein
MMRNLLALLVLAAPASAQAGGYVSAGIGGAPELGGELHNLSGEGHNSGRLAFGHGLGPVALELGVTGYGVTGTMPGGGSVDGEALSASISGKLLGGLVGGLDAFLRAGLQRTWIRTAEMEDLDGQGYVLGVGLDYAFPLAALWLEVDREFLDLSQGAGQFQGTADTLMAGVRVGI